MRTFLTLLFIVFPALHVQAASPYQPDADFWRGYINAATPEDQSRVIAEWLKTGSLEKIIARIKSNQEEALPTEDKPGSDSLGAFALTLRSTADSFAKWPRASAIAITDGKARPSPEQLTEMLRQAEFFTHYTQVFSYVMFPREPGTKPVSSELRPAGVQEGITVSLANLADAFAGLGEVSGDARIAEAATKAWAVVDNCASPETLERAIEPRYSRCPKDPEVKRRWLAAWFEKSRGFVGLLGGKDKELRQQSEDARNRHDKIAVKLKFAFDAFLAALEKGDATAVDACFWPDSQAREKWIARAKAKQVQYRKSPETAVRVQDVSDARAELIPSRLIRIEGGAEQITKPLVIYKRADGEWKIQSFEE